MSMVCCRHLFVVVISLLAGEQAFGLEVTRFGAVPNDGQDDTAAFLAAFKEAQAREDKRVVIPKGRYNLRSDGCPEHPHVLFHFQRVDGLAIDGRGAELVMSGAAGIFSFAECRNVVIRGLVVDWERPPFSEGTVVAAAARHFDVKVTDAYPVKGGEPVGAFMSYHPDTRLPDGRDLDVYNSVERTELVGPQVLRVHLTREIQVPVGKLLLLRHHVYGGNAFFFHRCSDVKVSDVTLYCAVGMGLVCGVCTDVSLERYNVLIRPGSGRLMSTTADASHFSGCKGTVSLKDCIFEGMGDDGVNVKTGVYLIVRRRLDDHTVLGQHNLKGSDLPDPGDTMEMAHLDTLSPFASGKVRSAKMEPGEGNIHRVEFEEPLPAELKVGDVLGNATRVARLRMHHCTVKSNRARGVLCQTRDAVIEDCTFQNCTSAGVLVLTEAVHFFESIGTRDVVVRNCRFENCNMGAATAEAALAALAYLKDFAYPLRPGVHRDVSFEGNHIVGTSESAIFAVGVDGLKVTGNRISKACLRSVRESGRYAIRIRDCARLIVEKNTIDPASQGARMTEPIHMTGSQ